MGPTSPEQIIPVKVRYVAMGMVLFLLLSLASLTQTLIRDDRKQKTQDLLDKGNYLVSLIALHPLHDLNGEKSDFFLRTLAEYVSSEGLVYCFIHDNAGNPLLSLAPGDLERNIPSEVKVRALYAAGLNTQAFEIPESRGTFYEFSKPVFEGGKRNGTVRLGLRVPRSSVLDTERIGLLAMVSLFILAALFISYYGISRAFIPLGRLCQRIGNRNDLSLPPPPDPGRKGGVFMVVQQLQNSFHRLDDALRKAETDCLDMATKLGTAAFERNQVSRILNAINFGIIITDIQDNIIHINDYALGLLDMDREDVTDRALNDLIEQDEIFSFISQRASMNSAGSQGHIVTSFPERLPGETFEVSLSPMKDDDGSVIGKIVTIKNITNEKLSEKTKHEFVASIAHELRTPLTTIKSYNEMLMDGEVEDREMQKEFYNTISEETDRLNRLIENLLSISKIEMGNMTLNRGLVKSDWLVGDSLAAIEATAQGKGITVQKNLPDNFPTLIGDKELLKTAMVNLLSNAVKYTQEGGQIVFSLTEHGNMIIFDVMDNGFGISEEDMAHIFDKFYRSKDPKVAGEAGSGLGLAMTLEIIQLHGGEIEVQSELGEGTQFTVTLPREDYYLGQV